MDLEGSKRPCVSGVGIKGCERLSSCSPRIWGSRRGPDDRKPVPREWDVTLVGFWGY